MNRNNFLYKIGRSIILVGAIAFSGLEAKADSSELIEYAKYTGNFEGRRARVYDPHPNDGKFEPTIGVGHYLDRKNSRETFARVLPEVDYNLVYSGKTTLTDKQIDILFSEDISQYAKKAKKLFPNFDSYPAYLRQTLVDGCYRGDLFDSPKTSQLINKGNFRQAAEEYTNRGDYKNAEKKGMRGIIPRMNRNKEAMLKYAGEQK